jgi:hypothetical protein
MQSRYDKGETEEERTAYINCPMTRDEYEAFIDALLAADKTEFKPGETAGYFDGCLPIEVMAERGPRDAAPRPDEAGGPHQRAHGPQDKPYAVVQLRRDNALGTLYNIVGFQTKMKYGAQTDVFRMIPGLRTRASRGSAASTATPSSTPPRCLTPRCGCGRARTSASRARSPGVEGYVESAAMGLLAGRLAAAEITGRPSAGAATTATGALLAHITGGADAADLPADERELRPLPADRRPGRPPRPARSLQGLHRPRQGRLAGLARRGADGRGGVRPPAGTRAPCPSSPASPPRPPVPCTSATPSRRSSPTTWRAPRAAPSSCGSRTSTARAAARNGRRSASMTSAGSASTGPSPCCASPPACLPTARPRDLWSRGLLFACTCTRRDIAAAASAPHEGAPPMGPDGVVYPGTCRHRDRSGPLPETAVLRLDMARALPRRRPRPPRLRRDRRRPLGRDGPHRDPAGAAPRPGGRRRPRPARDGHRLPPRRRPRRRGPGCHPCRPGTGSLRRDGDPRPPAAPPRPARTPTTTTTA